MKVKLVLALDVLSPQDQIRMVNSHQKARIVAQGFKQIKVVNCGDSLIPTFASLQVALTIAHWENWKIQNFDIKTAYLHSEIDGEVYFNPPPGSTSPNGSLWQLKKALYGTRQAGHAGG